jgi:hypothetical protein
MMPYWVDGKLSYGARKAISLRSINGGFAGEVMAVDWRGGTQLAHSI